MRITFLVFWMQTKIFRSLRKCQCCSDSISTWLGKWRLKANCSKTVFKGSCTVQTRPNEFRGKKLTRAQKQKFWALWLINDKLLTNTFKIAKLPSTEMKHGQTWLYPTGRKFWWDFKICYFANSELTKFKFRLFFFRNLSMIAYYNIHKI